METGSSSSTSGSHSSLTSTSSSSNKEKVNAITVTGSFLEGVTDAGRDSVKGVWNFLAHPIKGLTSTSECIVFVGKAIVPGTDANKAFAKIAEKFVSDVSQGNANENAKRIGRIVGEIVICVIVDHGVGMLTDIISESGKLEELSMLVGKAQKGEVTREEVASRLIDGASEAISKGKIEHVLTDHTYSRMSNTINKMMEKGLNGPAEKLLNKKSFFNPSWSEEKVIDAANQAYNKVLSKGFTNGEHTVKVFGENITVYLEDGVFRSAYGDFKLTLSDFGF